MKVCKICGDDNPKAWHGKRCRKCFERARMDRHSKPDYRYNHALREAKRRNKDWEITFDDFCLLIQNPCSYCKNILGALETYGTGLDRIDNSRGYYLDNVIPCCKICNSIRNNYLSVEETQAAVSAIIEYRKMNRVAL